jgi:hypothetical protein
MDGRPHWIISVAEPAQNLRTSANLLPVQSSSWLIPSSRTRQGCRLRKLAAVVRDTAEGLCEGGDLRESAVSEAGLLESVQPSLLGARWRLPYSRSIRSWPSARLAQRRSGFCTSPTIRRFAGYCGIRPLLQTPIGDRTARVSDLDLAGPTSPPTAFSITHARTDQSPFDDAFLGSRTIQRPRRPWPRCAASGCAAG